MTSFTIFNETNAPSESKSTLKSVKAKYGFVPNLMGELAASPAALEAYSSLQTIYGQTSLTAAEQQLVLLTTSYENNCQYCMAAHSTLALNVGLDREVLIALREGREIESDQRLEGLRLFTLAVVRNRGLVEKEEIESFLQIGFTKANILDVITGVTLKTLSNYTNHIAETELDPAFEAMAWSKPLLQHAD
jgi:uncharacterized peroxidase-related enzyme